jgi:CPA2 family monovalent cation:H+ antiporter-2
MHQSGLLLTLSVCLAAALVAGYVTQRIGLSAIVGYLLAGIAVGPFTPGFVADPELALELAEVGVILLMFGVGLQFHFKELLALRRIAVPGAVGQSLVTAVLATLGAKALGWDWTAGIVYGLSIAVASTVVLVRVLADHNDLHTRVGHIAIGWLVVEDLFTVFVLVLLPALAGSEEEPAKIGVSMLVALAKVVGVVALTIPIGSKVLPWLLGRVAATRSRELFTLTILVVALGIAVGSATLFDVSMALGAFLAGMVVGRSDFSTRAATEALPMRDAFAVLFFVSVGMLFDPAQIFDAPFLFLLTAAIVLVGKPLAAILIVRWLGYPMHVSLAVAAVLAQIGEFSFILVGLGHALGVVPEAANNAVVATALISISINPLVYRSVGPLGRWIQRHPRLAAWMAGRVRQRDGMYVRREPAADAVRAIVIGYGPVGRTVTRLLQENGFTPTVIEMNLDTVRDLRAQGIDAIYGDAGDVATLRRAGIDTARGLILSSSGLSSGPDIIRAAREINPELRVLARVNYVREQAQLQQLGAQAVVSGEGEVALAFAELMMRALGATPEQIERERERVRTELSA